MDFSFRQLSPETWNDFTALLGERGGCGGCWCMSWRVTKGGKTWESMKGEPARQAMHDLVKKGQAKGVIAYHQGRPVAWCTFGPRTDFPRLETVKAYQHENTAGVWSVPCFFINREFRGMNLSTLLLEQAEQQARKAGAKILEGYPAPLTSAGKKLPAAFVWTGPEVIFQRCNFTELQRKAASKPLYHKVLSK